MEFYEQQQRHGVSQAASLCCFPLCWLQRWPLKKDQLTASQCKVLELVMQLALDVFWRVNQVG